VAREELKLAERDLAREEQLKASGVSAASSFDAATRSVQVARRILLETENLLSAKRFELTNIQSLIATRRAELQMARLDQDRCEIRSPFEGIVAERRIEPGELVTTGTPLVRLIDIARVEIPIQLPASEVVHLAVGHAAQLHIPGEETVSWSGEVARISPEIDQQNRTVAVYIRADNSEMESPLLPGLLVEARIEGRTYEEVVVIPRRALLDNSSFVKIGETAHRRQPRVLRTIGDDVLIAEGLTSGEDLILTNLELLFDGARVITSEEMNLQRAQARELDPSSTVPASAVVDQGADL
jgi:RND family efflux transporter MFP subunit